ncbi:MAG: sensor histidine kinase [Acidimicrobiia bacterium]
MDMVAIIVLLSAVAGFAAAITAAALRRLRHLRDDVEHHLRFAQASALDAKRAGEELMRLRRSFDALTEGVVVVDPSGAEVLRNSFAEAFSLRRPGTTIVARAVNDVLAAALTGSACDREVELASPARTYLVNGVPLRDDDAELIGALAIIDDATEQVRIDAIRRDFVANMSHELRTPIGAVALIAEALSNEDDPAVATRLRQRIRDEADRATRLVQDLLSLSEIEGRPTMNLVDLLVDDVVGEAAARVRVLAEERGIEIAHVASPGLILRGDSRQLASALGNLLENAVRYSERGALVTVRSTSDAQHVEISVEDEGIGIPSSELDRVFERFYRVDKARSRETGGTGLGLSIVRHVAINHGGSVNVRSREGDGSRFTLRLPAPTAGLMLVS